MTEHLVDLVHTRCGGVAFKLHRRPAYNGVLRASDIAWPEGITHNELAVCAHCQETPDIRHLRPVGGWA